MGEPARYSFDRCFDTGKVRVDPPEVLLERRLRVEFETKLSAARAEAFERGRAEGDAAARKSIEADMAAAAARLAGSADKLMKQVDRTCKTQGARALKVAQLAAERLAGELLRRYPLEGLTALFTDCIEHVRHAPHLAVRVNDRMAEEMQKRVTEIAAQNGYTGRVVVLGDPETSACDCRIEWADGGVARDFTLVCSQISDAVDRYLNTHAVRAVLGDDIFESDDAASQKPAVQNSNGAHNPQGVLA